jgi:hypothetical protein
MFLDAASGLSAKQWLTMLEIADGEPFQNASAEAYLLVRGARLVGNDVRARLSSMSAAHDRVDLRPLEDEIRYEGWDIPLRAKAEAIARHVINAFLAGDDLSLAHFRMITAPFTGILNFDDRTRIAELTGGAK